MANIRQFITEVIVRDKTKEGAAAAQSSFQKLGQSAQKSATAISQVDRVQTSARASYERMARTIDAGRKAHDDYQRSLRTLQRAQEQGIASDREAARMKQLLTQRFKEQSQAANEAQRATSGLTGVMGNLGKAAIGLGAAFLTFGAIKEAINQIVTFGATFEQQMSKVKAVTQSTGAEFEALGAQARQLGVDTVFTATEAAKGMEALAREGFETNQILAATPAILNQAAAASIDLTAAVKATAGVMDGFQLSADNATRVANLLTVASLEGGTTLNDLAAAMGVVGPQATTLGVGIEAVAASLATLANSGIEANQAGAALRKILGDLADPSKELASVMGGLTVESDGFAAVMTQLAREGISGAAAIQLFGDKAGPAFDIIARSVPAIEAMAVSLGTADEKVANMATTMRDNFSGAVEEMNGALEELALVAADTGFLDALTDAIKGITAVLRSDEIRGAAQFFGEALALAVRIIESAVDLIRDRLQVLIIIFTGLRDIAVETAKAIADTYEALAAKIGITTEAAAAAAATSVDSVESLQNALVDTSGAGDAWFDAIELGTGKVVTLNDVIDKLSAQVANPFKLQLDVSITGADLGQLGELADGSWVDKMKASFESASKGPPRRSFAGGGGGGDTAKIDQTRRAIDQLTESYERNVEVLELQIAGKEAEIPLLEAEWRAADAVADASNLSAEAKRKLLITERERARHLGQLKKELMAAKIAEDALTQARISAAVAAGNLDEAEMLERISALRQQNVELTEQQARAMAQIERSTEKQAEATEKIRRNLEANRDEAIARQEAPWRNLINNVDRLWDNFWDDFVEKGFSSFEDLWKGIKDMGKQLLADILKAAFDPIRQGIVNSITGTGQGGGGGLDLGSLLGGLFGGGGGGTGSATVNRALNIAGGGGAAPNIPHGDLLGAMGGGGGLGSLGGIDSMFNSIFGGSGGLSGLLADILPGVAIFTMGSSLATALVDLVGKKLSPSSQQVTEVIGGLFGGIAGALYGIFFGREPSNYAAGAWLDPRGNVTQVEGSKSTPETREAARAAAEAAGTTLRFLMDDLGATLTNTIKFISVGTRDLPSFGLTSGYVARAGSSPDDLVGVVDAALKAVLKDATFADPVIQEVAHALAGTTKSFDEISKTLSTLKSVLGDTEDQLSKWAEALKTLHDTFDPLIEEFKNLPTTFAALTNGLARAIAALRTKFADEIGRAILQLESPLTLQFRDLIENQAKRIADANALGADANLLGQVAKLNRLEFEQFLETAKQTVGSLKDIRDQIESLAAEAVRLGQPLGQIITAIQEAVNQLVTTFDRDIANQLAALVNPTKAALVDLLTQQRERTRIATELGANLVAVERLNAEERRKFFENLSDEQKRQLGDVLGLIETYGGRIAVVLAKVNEAFDTQIDQMEKTRAEVERMRDVWKNFAEAVAGTRQGIVDRYGPGSPLTQLDELKNRFATLRADALAGNESAQAALPQVAQSIIDRAREIFGTTPGFFAEYQSITQALSEIELAANAQAAQLQTEADRLTTQVTLLTEIRDALRQTDPSLPLLTQQIARIDSTNSILKELLTEYVALTKLQIGQNAGPLNLTQAQIDALLGPVPGSGASTINVAAIVAAVLAAMPPPTPAPATPPQPLPTTPPTPTQPPIPTTPPPTGAGGQPTFPSGFPAGRLPNGLPIGMGADVLRLAQWQTTQGAPAVAAPRITTPVTVPPTALATVTVAPSGQPATPASQATQGDGLTQVVIALTEQTQVFQTGLSTLTGVVEDQGRELARQRVALNAAGTRRISAAVP